MAPTGRGLARQDARPTEAPILVVHHDARGDDRLLLTCDCGYLAGVVADLHLHQGPSIKVRLSRRAYAMAARRVDRVGRVHFRCFTLSIGAGERATLAAARQRRSSAGRATLDRRLRPLGSIEACLPRYLLSARAVIVGAGLQIALLHIDESQPGVRTSRPLSRRVHEGLSMMLVTTCPFR
jgi:hypothetical protein